ncbi:MAG TPA: UDP-N-acetylglucosamine--N-acetylmuramyl-(pentapeptide) pyrophosphoryl-undecaprenol N-acetylglucosamine transferase [Waddliaceae bacterium]
MKNMEDPSLKGGLFMNKKIIIAVGGTGGHIYPALAVAEELKKRCNELNVLFVGGELTKNPYMDQSLFSRLEISCGSLSWKKPMVSLINAGKIIKGVTGSYKILREFQPSLLLGFGSYHTLPMLLAAQQAEVPYILHEQNSVLGRVNRLLSKRAILTGVFFPEAARQVKGLAVEVGMPLRQAYRKGSQSEEEAKNYFGLNILKPVILMFGGSQGAQSLNQEFVRGVENTHCKNFSVLHFTGNSKATEEFKIRYERCGIAACVKNFEHRMELAWQTADLLVSRAGAGTIAEQIEFEVPGILVPYPHAMDNHQETNADFMVNQVGGAIKLSEREFAARNLVEEALDMLNNKNVLTRKQSISEYKKLHKPQNFCSLILKFI